MSADDYLLVRKTGDGKFVVLRGFSSDPTEPEVQDGETYVVYDTPLDAFYGAQKLGAEYGVSIHPECGNVKLSKSKDE